MDAPKRILIMDADPEVRRTLLAALDAPDRRIECAEETVIGLSLINRFSYDLILADMSLPGLDGMTLIQRLHEIMPKTKIVVMTTGKTPENIIAAIRSHAFSYFSKPLRIQAVADMVSRALSTESEDDDIQVLSASPHWLGLRLRCKMETADRILHFMRELGMDLPASEQEHLATAFREILLNAIEHGGASNPEQKVTITYVRTKRALMYYVRDPGKGFSFEKLPHAAVSNPIESPVEHAEIREKLGMRPGGFGILMSRQLVDELIYNESGNEVLLIQYLDTDSFKRRVQN